jgi:hypothetical protein
LNIFFKEKNAKNENHSQNTVPHVLFEHGIVWRENYLLDINTQVYTNFSLTKIYIQSIFGMVWSATVCFFAARRLIKPGPTQKIFELFFKNLFFHFFPCFVDLTVYILV